MFAQAGGEYSLVTSGPWSSHVAVGSTHSYDPSNPPPCVAAMHHDGMPLQVLRGGPLVRRLRRQRARQQFRNLLRRREQL
jgi:hypothetical protein